MYETERERGGKMTYSDHYHLSQFAINSTSKKHFFSKVDRDNDVKGLILISDEVENRV